MLVTRPFEAKDLYVPESNGFFILGRLIEHSVRPAQLAAVRFILLTDQ